MSLPADADLQICSAMRPWPAAPSTPGISAAYAYPGTPSTEIFQTIQTQARLPWVCRCAASGPPTKRWHSRKAWGVSYAGKRAIVAMKHVGLNVAADPFMNVAVSGAHGGLVIVVADDPSMHSSQNEQDSRYFADFAMVPCLEPADQQQCYDFTREAFELSERLRMPGDAAPRHAPGP